jgi:phosphoserine phosphatase RsbX
LTAIVTSGCAGITKPGQERSGDAGIVEHVHDGVLMGVIDGLGHGPEAAEAASVALETLHDFAGDDLLDIFERTDKAVSGMRGVVLSVAWFDLATATMSWAGVGNVAGVLISPGSKSQHLLLHGGVAGVRRLPHLRVASVTLQPGDVVVMATDGVSQRFSVDLAAVVSDNDPQEAAEVILDSHATGHDDAFVAVARWEGAP